MKTMMVLLSVLVFVATSCTDDGNRISATGRVAYMSFEGGFYGLITDTGDHYLPENLASEFQKDSLRIYFEGTITDRPTTQQWGRTITLRRIERIR
jgi:hypothetical protein